MQSQLVDTEWDPDMLVPIVHPDHVHEIMGKYNKFLNKHERSQRCFEGLVPGVMMFADSDHPLWEARKKAVTDIFTKETKKAIADVMFNHVWDKIQGWVGTEVDLFEKINEIQGHLTMEIALGSDVGAVFLDYEKADGSFCKMNVCDYSVALLQDGLSRDWKNLKGLFPYLETKVKQCTRERDDRNAKRALEAMLGLVAKRQDQLKNGEKPSGVLAILLADPTYQQLDAEMGNIALQDTLLVCVGGSRNPSTSIANTIAHLLMTKNSESFRRAQSEVDAFFADAVQNSAGKSPEEIKELYRHRLANQGDDDLTYTSLCWTESMRIEAPFQVTTSQTMTQDVVLCQGTDHELKLHKNQPFTYGIFVLHNDPTQYTDPQSFLPERWESSNPLYQTPSGCPRHAKSYIPLSGGKRACLGKAWMEINHRVMLAVLLHQVKFEFADKENLTVKQPLNFFVWDTPAQKV